MARRIEFWVFVLATIVVSLAHFSNSAIDQFPNGSPLCQNQTATGGMFGYSLTLADDGNNTYMAVGKPWDETVYIYKVPTPNMTAYNLTTNVTREECYNTTTDSGMMTATASFTTMTMGLNSTSCINITETNTTFVTPTMPQINWTLIANVSDPYKNSSGSKAWNGTSLGGPYSLFGYDVALSKDGQWLAVGVPARSYPTRSEHFMYWPYHGSTLLYQKQSNDAFSLVRELNLTTSGNRTAKFFDRFGSKVLFSSDPNSRFLFIVSNGGWDGTSEPGQMQNGRYVQYGMDYAINLWPRGQTTDTSNLGIHVYQRNGAGQWNFLQFLRAESEIPLGMLGIDMSVTCGDTFQKCILAAREYASDIKFGGVDGPSGSVAIYTWDFTNVRFQRASLVQSGAYGSQSSWQNEDWFGVGIAVGLDTASRLGVLNVGAPRAGSKVYNLVASEDSIWQRWNSGHDLVHPAPRPRTFYGGAMALSSPDPRFLLVSDATAPDGRGNVYMFHRRRQGETVVGFENVVRPVTSSNSPFIYDHLATYHKDNGTRSGFAQDHFGKVVKTIGHMVVVGAPVDECVFTYSLPFAYIPPDYVPPTLPTTSISTQVPTQTGPPVGPPGISEDKTRLYVIIGAIVGLIVIIPLTLYIAMRRHKQRILANLKQQAAMMAAHNPGSPTSPEMNIASNNGLINS